MYSRVSFVLSAATFVTVFTLFCLIICTYKLIRKCIKDRNPEAESATDHATSKITSDCEFNSSVHVNNDGKGSTNEGFMVEIPPEYTAEMETFPNAGQPNEEPPVTEPGKELPNTNFDSSQTEKEMVEIGSTRFTSDGSMNTRF